MTDPVILVATGRSYERANIEAWFELHPGRNPSHPEETLTDTRLLPNANLRALIMNLHHLWANPAPGVGMLVGGDETVVGPGQDTEIEAGAVAGLEAAPEPSASQSVSESGAVSDIADESEDEALSQESGQGTEPEIWTESSYDVSSDDDSFDSAARSGVSTDSHFSEDDD